MTMSTIARSPRPGERCALIFIVPQIRLMPLIDLPELLRPWVRAFIADKPIFHPISLLQEIQESPALL